MYRQQNRTNDLKSASCPKCGSTRLLYGRGKLTCTNCSHVIGALQNKYNAKKQEYGGHLYDSKLEASYAAEFDTMLKAGELTKVERQVTLSLKAYGQHICNYKIDFILTHKDGHREYAEIKGMELPLWRMKWRLLEAQLAETEPSAELRVYK